MTVTTDAGGLHVSDTRLRAGLIRFKVSTTVANGSQVTLFSLRRGATLTDIAGDVAGQFSSDRAVAAKSSRDLNKHARFYGLAGVGPKAPVTVTVKLAAGTYYAALLGPGFKPSATSVTKIRVLGRDHGGRHHGSDRAQLPRTRATITMKHHRFLVSGQLPAKGQVRVRNADHQLHFVGFAPVDEGTTDAQVQRYFDSGSQEEPDFIREGPDFSVDLLSRGREVVVGYDLPKGTYVMVCFVADEKTGVPHALKGMHKVVTLR